MLRIASYSISSYSISVWIQCTILIAFGSKAMGQVSYDCPTQVSATIVESGASHKIVEMLIPVSVSVDDERLSVENVKIEVNWNRNPNPVVDFAPKTVLRSQYEGAINVEKKSELRYGGEVSASSGYFDFLTPGISADVGKKDSETHRFNKLPPQDLLVASGTSQRGTGVYFRFEDNPTHTLEGSRDLIVAFEVPESWRGGVLQITFTSVGKRRKFASFQSDFEYARVFVLPTYLRGDEQARQFSNEFVNSELQLRKDWSDYESSVHSANQWDRWYKSQSDGQLPSLWMHHLIQSGSDVAYRKYESRLPRGVADSANEFIVARKNLFALSR